MRIYTILFFKRLDLPPRRFGESRCDAAKKRETVVSRCVRRRTGEKGLRRLCYTFPSPVSKKGSYLSFWRLHRHTARRGSKTTGTSQAGMRMHRVDVGRPLPVKRDVQRVGQW